MTKRECIKEFKLINNIKRMGVLEWKLV
jgi:hypothetical protein